MKRIFLLGVMVVVGMALGVRTTAPSLAEAGREACPRPIAGDFASSPPLLRSRNGLLDAAFALRNDRDERFCLVYGTVQSPTLWVEPGDTVVLRIRNELHSSAVSAGEHHHPTTGRLRNPCFGAGAVASPLRTNLHFHGLNIPSTCHADDVLGTLIPSGATFVYRFKIPANEPPGLYWYHPHPHGLSEKQVLGGATGALVVRGIERVNSVVRGLPEQVLTLRDAQAPEADSTGPRLCADQEGSTRPAKDISLNFVPVIFPADRPARMHLGSGERQFWRVLNASADTYFDLQLDYDGEPQVFEVVAMDGVPTRQDDLGRAYPVTLPATHVLLPPGARAEFIVRGPNSRVREARLLTLPYDTGPDGDCDPGRVLARIDTEQQKDLPIMPIVGVAERPVRSMRFSRISAVKPVRTRRLYFSENNDRGEFYITEDRPGSRPKLFDPFFTKPDITIEPGTVEDWIVENRSRESHAFHIHQIHFQVIERDGKPTNDPVLHDTIDVPFSKGKTSYSSVKLRMDFREPEVGGTFVYHCHILEHEDGGMMGTVEAKPVGKRFGKVLLQK